MAKSSRRVVVQFKKEVTEGVDPGSWSSTEVIVCREASVDPSYDQIALEEFGGTLDAGATIAGNPRPTAPLSGYLRGSGTPQTPIVSFWQMLECGTLTPTSYATTIPTSGTTTAASGTTTTLTFDRSAATDWPTGVGLASGLIGRIIEVTHASVTYRVPCIDYAYAAPNATITFGYTFPTALGATTTFKRPTQAIAEATSPSPVASGYLRVFFDGVMESLPGARPALSFNIEAGQPPTWTANFGGQYANRADETNPTAPTYLAPLITKNEACTVSSTGAIGVPLGFKTFAVDLGTQGEFPSNGLQTNALDPYILGRRRITCTIDPLAVPVADRNLQTVLAAGTSTTMCVTTGGRTGGTAGTRFCFTLLGMQIGNSAFSPDGLVLREAITAASGSFDYGLIVSHY